MTIQDDAKGRTGQQKRQGKVKEKPKNKNKVRTKSLSKAE